MGMFAWSLRSRPANMRGMVCYANRPARPAEPGDTISLRGLRPLKLPFDLVCLCSEGRHPAAFFVWVWQVLSCGAEDAAAAVLRLLKPCQGCIKREEVCQKTRGGQEDWTYLQKLAKKA